MIDGETRDFSKPIDLDVGEHDVEIEHPDYMPERERINVNAELTLSTFQLEEAQLAIINVQTDPSDAEVFLNSVKLQKSTPVEDFRKGGEYLLEIRKENYLPVKETIFLDPDKDKNTYFYELISNTGTISIKSDPEINCEVKLSGRTVGKTPITLDDQIVGEYQVTGSHELYIIDPQTAQIVRGETIEVVLEPKSNYAILTIKTNPGATIEINGKEENRRDHFKIAAQTAVIYAEKDKCSPREERIILEPGMEKTINMYLEEMTGSVGVTVTPLDATIKLTGDHGEHFENRGSKVFLNIPIGNYTLEINRKSWESHIEELVVKENEIIKKSVALDSVNYERELSDILEKCPWTLDYTKNTWRELDSNNYCRVWTNPKTKKENRRSMFTGSHIPVFLAMGFDYAGVVSYGEVLNGCTAWKIAGAIKLVNYSVMAIMAFHYDDQRDQYKGQGNDDKAKEYHRKQLETVWTGWGIGVCISLITQEIVYAHDKLTIKRIKFLRQKVNEEKGHSNIQQYYSKPKYELGLSPTYDPRNGAMGVQLGVRF